MTSKNKRLTPQQYEKGYNDYIKALNLFKELGLIKVIPDKGVIFNPKLQVNIIGQIPPELEKEEMP